jgi:hypothetical protein
VLSTGQVKRDPSSKYVCAKHWTGQKRPVLQRMFVLSTGQVKKDPSLKKYSKSSCANLILLKRLTFDCFYQCCGDESSFTVNFALELTCKTNSFRQDQFSLLK